MENTLALNHKLFELIESLKSLAKKINEEDLAEHEYREQQDLGFENANFESQALPSFDVYIPLVTYPEEVEETIGIPIEVEPFDQTQLEDVALGWILEEIHMTWAQLEKKRTRLRLYTKSCEEIPYSGWRRRRDSLRWRHITQETASGYSRRRQNVTALKETLEASSR
ncbi:hypothetical protein Tco_1120920 [Tanacetum coccineum]|uniref:Uncharacterized protein n=1 Tax=Tanacetum coccineum TaxID=301880 RepID=A0ABQ5IXQ3_9ASTR